MELRVRTPALWTVVGAGLAGVGGRFGRRAALRGALAAGATSLATRAVGGRPSSTAATAAGFAAGASLELPVIAAPIGLVAAAASAARVYAGDDSVADVVAGTTLGVAAAFASKQFWPVAPHEAARIRASLKSHGIEPSPTGSGLSIVVNDDAGPALTRSPVGELRDSLPDAEVIVVDAGDDVAAALERAGRSARAIGVAGGDGTVNAGAGIADSQGKPLMVVPAGTLNHLARDLGLASVTDAIDAVRKGQTADVDLAMIDGRPFLNTASFGSYVDLVDARERLERVIGKWPAVVIALWRVLRHSRPVSVEIDGSPMKVWMIFIGNCRYHPSGFTPSWRERLDDGELDVRIVEGDSPWSRTRLIASVLTGRLGRCRVYRQRRAKRIRVRSLEGPLRLARDGETFDGSEEFEIAKCERPLPIYAPTD